MTRSVVVAVVLCGAGLVASGCARTHARAELPPPPLEVPAPPPRVVETTGAEVPQPIGLATDPADGAPALPSRPTPAAGRPSTPRPPSTDAAKPEPPPAEVAKPADEPRPPGPALRAAPTQQEEALAAGIRTRLTRAQNELGRIDYRVLSADARDQYDRAKSFIREAEEALKTPNRNLPYADSLTEKALAIAAQLGGR